MIVGPAHNKPISDARMYNRFTKLSKTRWYQFRVRTLLLIMLATSILFSGYAVRQANLTKQGRIVAKLQQFGGEVEWDRWGNVRSLWFARPSQCKFSDDHVTLVRLLPNLHTLSLFGTNITDKALGQLADVRELRELCLAGTNVTDSGLKHLGRLHSLRSMHIEDTGVSDAGVKELQKLLPHTLIRNW